jgi:hypothetical protein
MPDMFIAAQSFNELKQLQLWLRETTGCWTQIEKGELMEDGRTFPHYQLEVFRVNVGRRRLTVDFIDRSASPATDDAVVPGLGISTE